ncbi:hypothetical protein ACWFMI_23995 [Nocardiopsis terrae]
MGFHHLVNDPQVRRRIAQLAEQTGVPSSQFVHWLKSPPPPGISRRDWWDSLRAASQAPPISEAAMDELAAMVAPHRTTSKAQAA